MNHGDVAWIWAPAKKVSTKSINQKLIKVKPIDPIQHELFQYTINTTFTKYAQNSEGVIFKFTPSTQFTPSVVADEVSNLLIIKVAYYQKEYDDYYGVCQLILDATGLSKDQVKDLIHAGLTQIINQIDALTLAESFNKTAAEKIFDTIKLAQKD